ncbi:hypothetical protein [Granulimonas faecalis]|uniref:hypothetical protein n=1 Tax=Granulimonas faecalis TaxID=2894155 RepID=UPI003513B56F
MPRNSEVDLACWNREGLEEAKPGANVLAFNYEIGEGVFQKALGYLKYRRFVKRILISGKYDLVVVTPTQTALLLSDVLIRHYAHRYIVDIRDYCHENLWFVRSLEKRVIGDAVATVISSSGYREFLPSDESYCLVHNNRELPESKVETVVRRDKDRRPLTIGFVGFVAYHEQHKRLIRLFANDDRFVLAFIGAGSAALADFCQQEGISNVDIRGSFKPDEIMDIYSGLDIINGIYGENCPELDYALSNKLYFAGDLAMPIIVNAGTIMQEVSERYGMGFAVDMSDPATPDKLYKFYKDINWDDLSSGAREFMRKVREDNEEFEVKMENIFKDKD